MTHYFFKGRENNQSPHYRTIKMPAGEQKKYTHRLVCPRIGRMDNSRRSLQVKEHTVRKSSHSGYSNKWIKFWNRLFKKETQSKPSNCLGGKK